MNTAKRAQFTPGPWSLCNWMVGNNTPTGEVTICGPEGDEHICTMDGNENNQANGNLIAAAPAMYEELGKCVSLIRALQERLNAHEEMCNFDDEEIAGAIAALAQAEGSNHA